MPSTAPNPQTAAAFLKRKVLLRPDLAIVLGSGFQQALSRMKIVKEISYDKIPGFPKVGVHGHAGKLVLGKLGGTTVAVLSGRVHYYEGHDMTKVTFAVRTLAAFGIKSLLLTNAAGGVNRSFRAGDFMALTDHINFMGVNPLRGPAIEGLPRFVDMTRTYDPGLQKVLTAAARQTKLKLRAGVYLAVTGPSYETPSEVEAFARLGADAVGMSTVPEAIVARQCGVKVCGLSCITNLAAGRGGHTLTHTEVLETAERVKNAAASLLESFARNYSRSGV